MNTRAARWLVWLLALIASLAGATVAQARSGVPLATCFRPALPGMTPRTLFADVHGFDCARSQARLPSGDYWVVSAPLPAAIPTMASVRTASVWQRRVTLYTLFADGTIRRAGFTSATTAPHLRLGATIDLPLPADPAAPPIRLLWHVEGAGGMRGVVVGPLLAGHEDRARDDVATMALYAAFAGMGVGLLLYNLALWRALRQSFQPAYCLMLLGLLVYAASSSGWIEQVTGMDNDLRLRFNYLLLATAAASAVVFARAFFEKPVFAGGVGTLARAVVALLLGTALAFVILAPWRIAQLDRAVTASYLLLILLVAAVLVRAWRVRSRYLAMFALAWGVPIVLAGIRIAAALDLIAWHFWVDNSTVPAMALEACLSGFAIAGRIRLISHERDEARILADVDPLTGLLNRRAFLAQAIGRAEPQTLVIVDIDHFKRVNEAIGHDGGDEVLRIVARSLADQPAGALVARLGGEEFAILAPAAAAPAASAILDRLRAAPMPHGLAVTASLGSCTGPLTDEDDWRALYGCADRALFDAKAAGRDRARQARPLPRAA